MCNLQCTRVNRTMVGEHAFTELRPSDAVAAMGGATSPALRTAFALSPASASAFSAGTGAQACSANGHEKIRGGQRRHRVTRPENAVVEFPVVAAVFVGRAVGGSLWGAAKGLGKVIGDVSETGVWGEVGGDRRDCRDGEVARLWQWVEEAENRAVKAEERALEAERREERERMRAERAEAVAWEVVRGANNHSVMKRKRGRPKGSKNKVKER